MDEYEKLEVDLKREYEVYLEKFRNLDYLEHRLDEMNAAEELRVKQAERALKRMQARLNADVSPLETVSNKAWLLWRLMGRCACRSRCMLCTPTHVHLCTNSSRHA